MRRRRYLTFILIFSGQKQGRKEKSKIEYLHVDRTSLSLLAAAHVSMNGN